MAQPSPIEQFGKYQILERIARGGMAEIFKARMEGIGGFNRLFAIKRIVPGLSQNREYIDLLVDEAKIAGLLSHANIVQILDLGQVNGQYYVAMEYVEGRDLGTVVRRCRERGITLPVPHAVFILIEVLKGLEYAHNRQIMRGNRPMPLNIIHRDVSPSNVLVSFQGEVKLTDFGIAKANVKAMETLSGVIKGKFDYMSPEQASGNALDQRTDLFAAGVLLFEMLCGEHPFRQSHEMKTIAAIRAGEYKPPSFVNPDVPYGLEVVIDQALARDPNERFATATAFKDALTKFFHDAGFIFSHSTLAAFLKGLFPEANVRRRRGERGGKVLNLRDQETRPLGEDDELDEDRPTTLDELPPPAPPPRPAPRAAPRQSAPRPSAPRPSAPRPSAPRPSAPRQAPRQAPHQAPRSAPRSAPRQAPHQAPRQAPRASPRQVPRAAPRQAPPTPLPPTAPSAPSGGQSTIMRRRAPPRRARPVALPESSPSVEPTHTNPGPRAAPRPLAPPPEPPQRLARPPAPSGVFSPRAGDMPRDILESDTLLRQIPPENVRPKRPTRDRPPAAGGLPQPSRSLVGVEESTLIRKPDPAMQQAISHARPSHNEAEERAAQERIAEWSDEVNTQVKNAPVAVHPEPEDDEISLDESTHSATLELDEPSIAQMPSPMPRVAPVEPAAPVDGPPATPRVMMLLLAGFCGATLGVALGMVLGVFVGWSLGKEVAPAAPVAEVAVVDDKPQLQVFAPEDARVMLDGRLKGVIEGSPITLNPSAGEAFTMRVELDDVVLHEAELELEAGEQLQLHVVPAAAE